MAEPADTAHKNKDLAATCQRLCRNERARRSGGVAFVHVKGHSGDRWNDAADGLVQQGKLGSRSEGVAVLGPSSSPALWKTKRQATLDFAAVPKKRKAPAAAAAIDLTL